MTNIDPAAVAEHWAEAVADILHSMADERPAVKSSTATAEPPPGLLWWQQVLDTNPEPCLWIGAPEATWHDFGKRTLEAAGVGDAGADDARNTYFEILNPSLGVTARHIGKTLGTEVNCADGSEGEVPSSGDFFEVWFAFSSAELQPVWFVIATPLAGRPAAAGQRAGRPQQATPPPEAESEREPPVGNHVDLLYDVELPVVISFGRASLSIKEVLKLSTGSIVELNRGVSEPVEIVVNNCVVARGEVVVVEGNYGVRIQEIVSRQDRMRSSYR